MGWAYCLTGRYAEAVIALEETISQSPNFPPAHFYLTASYVEQWAFQQSPDSRPLAQALAAAQRLIALNDSFPRVIGCWGMSICGKSSMSKPSPRWSGPVALDPTDAWGFAVLAEVLSYVGRPEEAVRMVEQALRLKALYTDRHLDSVGAAYSLAGRPEEAIVGVSR